MLGFYARLYGDDVVNLEIARYLAEQGMDKTASNPSLLNFLVSEFIHSPKEEGHYRALVAYLQKPAPLEGAPVV